MDQDTKDPKKIVRVYSFEAQDRFPPESNVRTLGRVLTDQEPSLEDILEPWRKFYEPWEAPDIESNPITKVLAVEAEKLRQQWLQFRKQNLKEDQLEVNQYEPTIEGVFNMVADVEKTWQAKRERGKRGKAMMYFHRLCRTLDSHSNILEVVPKGNEYVSIFAGTITTIIKASANHENIAEELSQALSMISEHVADCETEMELFKTEEMQRAIADLYAHIFLFLNDTLVWYTKKRRRRLLDSMNEKFLQEFELEIDNIIRKSERIKRKASQMAMAEQRVTRLTMEETNKDLRLGLEGILRENAETKYYAQQFSDQFERQRREQQQERNNNALLYQNLIKLLTDAAQSNRESISSLSLEGEASGKRRSFVGGLAIEDAALGRDQLLLDSAILEDFFHRDRVCLVPDFFDDTTVPPEAIANLAEWTKELTSTPVLCVSSHEFSGDELNSPTTLLAAKFIDFASVSHVPVASYFCELRRKEKLYGDNSPETQGLISLGYSLLRQMIELVPMEFESSKDFSKDRFEELDGTLRTWSSFKELFRDTQSVLLTRLYCVIDGLQWLDDSGTSRYLAEFVEILRHEKLKVLFTTSGPSRCLLECLSRDELVLLEGRMATSFSSLWKLEEGMIEFG
ncbi:hypothetical protein N0V90_010620 [Kalmusia sp. IMI 367209]|nr:hypothetical protein N0V90_010620 [Kalmusia sp. IMI 367209]